MEAEAKATSEPPIDRERLPRHVAVIMDGNGRWAQERGLERVEGHRAGAESVRAVVRTSRELGIRALTLFAFSEQNWERPQQEVEALMELLHRYLLEEREEIMGNAIRLTAIGSVERLPPFVRKALSTLMELSAKNSEMTLCLALSYGGREDIVAAARALAERAARGEIDPATIDTACFEQALLSASLPPVDLLIRTSGEQRFSNFLLWQSAYAELVFSNVMWPEFRRPQYLEALAAYQGRERRFGLTSEQVATS